jgi:hypothetical protein
MAVEDPKTASWLLATRLSGAQALALAETLQRGLDTWDTVPCLTLLEFPMQLSVNLQDKQVDLITMPNVRIEWHVLGFPGGDLARPRMTLGLWVQEKGPGYLATVTMDLTSARTLRHQLVRLAATVDVGAPVHSEQGSSDGGPGWSMLFDGSSLEHFRGFKKATMPAGWEIVDGTLTCMGSGGDIITRSIWDNFELELEWKVAEGGNSGIFFNVTEDHDFVWETGPEMQILDDARHGDGDNPMTSAGANYGLHAPLHDVDRPAGEWNKAKIIVCNNNVSYWLNGVEVVAYTLYSQRWNNLVSRSKFNTMPDYGQRASGHIALQDHGDTVSYRNIRIRDLGASEDLPWSTP